MRLADKRVLVVGASAGIGRASGLAIAAEGARVAFAARRLERLEEAAAEAGNGAIALQCDVADDASSTAAVAAAADAFGGLDALVYTPGIAKFAAIDEIDGDAWRAVLDTNLVGTTVVMRAAVEHLSASRGKALFFSSIVIDDSPPRPGGAPYVVSKVALEALVRAWQGEHPRIGFTTIAMGDTLSEFGLDQDMAKLGPIVERWSERGYMYGRLMEAKSVAELVVNALASRETVRRIAVTPHYAAADDGDAE